MPISERIKRERQDRYDRRMAEAQAKVPEGLYCYGHTGDMKNVSVKGGEARVPQIKMCPYWKRRGDKPEQANGYCRLLQAGDWMPRPHGTMLLWDQVKECDINPGDNDDD